MKLQDRGQQIDDFSMRVKTHTDTLQMSLQIVIIKIALATPDFLLRQLGAALEDLRVRLSRIESNSNPSMTRVDCGHARGVQFLEHAREALRSGTTLYEASTAGSIADIEPVLDIERTARIKKWASNVDALRKSPNDDSGVALSDTVSAHVCAEKNSGEEVDENSSHTSSSEPSADSLSEGQSVSDSDTNSVAPVEATHTISLASDDGTSSIPEPLVSGASVKMDLVAIGDVDHASADGNEGTASPSLVVPGCPDTEIRSLHVSSKNSSSTRSAQPLSHESPAKTTGSEKEADDHDGSDKESSISANASLEDTDEAKKIPFKYPMDTSQPLDRATRELFMSHCVIEITDRLEKLICTGERIEPATLPDLATTDQTASSEAQTSGGSGLALLLAVLFRDAYLIKPLVKLGFSPNAPVKRDDDDLDYGSPLHFAISTRCEPVIQQLLDNGAKSSHTCNESPWFALLHHDHLRLAPPSSVESIQKVINLLAPASAPDLVTCVCEPKDDNCQDWNWSLLGDAMDMPADLSHYGILLVTHILEYSVSADRLSRYTADSPLCNAIFLDDLEILEFLMEAADQTTLKA
ncbi:hypothetical protein Q7P35_001779 [Cladosporium inversicolor]